MPYKRTYRKRRSNFSKSVKNIVRRMSETKCHYEPVAISTAVSTDGGQTPVVRVPSGGAGDQRIGSTIQLRHLKMSVQINPVGGNSWSVPFRLMLFYSPSESTVSLVDYLTGSYDPKRFFPLYDKYHSVPSAGTSTVVEVAGPRCVNISKRIRYYQKYSGITNTDLTKGHLILVLNQHNNAQVNYNLNGRVECWYDDI